MNLFLAQIKHKLVSTQSDDFKTYGEEIQDCFKIVKSFFFDTGFKVVGFADLEQKKYFFLTKYSRFGDLLEIPLSIQFVQALDKATDIEKQRAKKALKRDDFMKFQVELTKMMDNQFVQC
jgi:hypothetical protein